MQKKLQNKLFKKYPGIFERRKLPMNKNCMCRGIETGDGWFDLINDLCFKLLNIEQTNNIEIFAEQVKEKFGGLRFYVSISKASDELTKTIYSIINSVEEESFTICEECGALGELKKFHGWFRTCCDKHLKEYEHNI